MLQEVAELLDKGVKVIADVDDYLRGFIGKQDHDNSAKYTDEYIQQHEDCLSVCDLVTTSTQFIADKIALLGVDTMVIPNALKLDRWEGLRLANAPKLELVQASVTKGSMRRAKRGGKYVIIGWSGSTGHRDAFAEIAKPLSRVLRTHSEARFVSMGDNMVPFLDADVVLDGKCEHIDFVPFPDHPSVISQFNINIGPAADTDFYRAKSDLRCLEAWASGSVFVGGESTYGATVKHGEDGFICRSEDDWYRVLSMLVTSTGLRRTVSQAGYDRLTAERTIEKVAPLWREAIERVM
jgi:hypothetical protein